MRRWEAISASLGRLAQGGEEVARTAHGGGGKRGRGEGRREERRGGARGGTESEGAGKSMKSPPLCLFWAERRGGPERIRATRAGHKERCGHDDRSSSSHGARRRRRSTRRLGAPRERAGLRGCRTRAGTRCPRRAPARQRGLADRPRRELGRRRARRWLRPRFGAHGADGAPAPGRARASLRAPRAPRAPRRPRIAHPRSCPPSGGRPRRAPTPHPGPALRLRRGG